MGARARRPRAWDDEDGGGHGHWPMAPMVLLHGLCSNLCARALIRVGMAGGGGEPIRAVAACMPRSPSVMIGMVQRTLSLL